MVKYKFNKKFIFIRELNGKKGNRYDYRHSEFFGEVCIRVSLNVFTELSEFSEFNDKNNIVLKKGIAVHKPAFSCVRHQHSTSVPGRHR